MHDSIKTLQTIAAVSVLSMASANVYADPICLPSTNADICVTERSNSNKGSYTIKNDGEIPVVAFGVTNPSSSNADTETIGWQGMAITQAQWDAGVAIGFYNGYETFGGPIPGTDFFSPPEFVQEDLAFSWNTNELGSYESLFGADETTVNFYWQEAYPLALSGLAELVTLVDDGVEANGFFWNTNETFSNFAAFGPGNNNQGQLLAQTPITTTPPSAVPVPAALPLMASALGLFGIARRKKA